MNRLIGMLATTIAVGQAFVGMPGIARAQLTNLSGAWMKSMGKEVTPVGLLI